MDREPANRDLSSSARRSASSAALLPATQVGRSLADLRVGPRLHRGVRSEKVGSGGDVEARVVSLSGGNSLLFVTPAKVWRGHDDDDDGGGGGGSADDSGKRSRHRHRYLDPEALARTAVKKYWDGRRERATRHIDAAVDVVCVLRGYAATRRFELLREKDPRRLEGGSTMVSVVYRDWDTLDLLVRDRRDGDDLVDALRRIRDAYHRAKVNVGNEELLLRYVWYGVDKDHNGRIEPNELVKVLDRVNLHQSKGETKRRFKEFVRELHSDPGHRHHSRPHLIHSDDGLTFEQCAEFLRRQKLDARGADDDDDEGRRGTTMEDEIWDWVFGGDFHLVTAEDFCTKFLRGAQGESDATPEDARAIFSRLNGMELSGAASGSVGDGSEDDTTGWEVDGVAEVRDTASPIDRVRFAAYLRSDANDLYDPASLDMDASTLNEPLSRYWINSSHNTYLAGDQLQSDSSVEMYTRALYRGCRCLEIDCWDGDKERDGSGGGEKVPVPIVYHGHTATGKVRFADIVRCVRGYVDDHPDTFPIILSLENHCSVKYQQVMAKVLRDVLGDALYVPDHSDIDGDLPSPMALRGKVVIKGKRPPVPDGEEDDEDDPYDLRGTATGSESSDDRDDDRKKSRRPKIVPALAAVTLFHGTKYESFEVSIEEPTSHMHSIGENKVSKILSDPSAANMWRHYNLRHMTRTYPAASRVSSSNYSPILPWYAGCQLVALNFQTTDSPLVVNDGRFRENGGCGYVPKPRSVAGGPDATPPPPPGTLRIRVLSGSCIPKTKGKAKGECVDPYVKITVHDAVRGKDGAIQNRTETHRTRTVKDNGFCPVWDERSYAEFVVRSPDAAVVQFSVRDDEKGTDDTIAEAAVPVNRVRCGYRCVRLFDRNGERAGPFDFATILVEVVPVGG